MKPQRKGEVEVLRRRYWAWAKRKSTTLPVKVSAATRKKMEGRK